MPFVSRPTGPTNGDSSQSLGFPLRFPARGKSVAEPTAFASYGHSRKLTLTTHSPVDSGEQGGETSSTGRDRTRNHAEAEPQSIFRS